MPKRIIFALLLTFIIFSAFSCSNKKEISKDAAIQRLKSIESPTNLKIITTTVISYNGNKTYSYQTSVYSDDICYNSNQANDINSKTWYGYVNNNLFAFYYTRNETNEIKYSSRINESQFQAIKHQPLAPINSLFDKSDSLVNGYSIYGTVNNNIYNIIVENPEEFIKYNINIIGNRVNNIVIEENNIVTNFEYIYDTEKLSLPSLNEYPLSVSN